MSTLYIPAGSITNAEIATSAAIGAAKLVHHFAISYTQAEGTAIVAERRIVFIAKAAGTLAAVKAAVYLGATGADRTVDVNIQKSTGGGATATVLSANIQFVDATTDLTVSTGTISASTYAASDIYEVVITVAGSAGNQAQGLIVTLYFEEPTS